MTAEFPRRRELTLEDYCRGVLARDRTVLPRAITLVESSHARHQRLAEELLTRLLPHTGRAIRVGITGVPGVGKSTFIEALGLHLVGGGSSVAVLAVDPSSNVSGGSILGDKTRMGKLAAHERAYIRPSPAAGTLGGVARTTRESMLLCEAAGYDVVLVETVGVGQSETLVHEMTDCFLALMLPGAGDELQGIKRGLLELVDVIAVNKADGAMRAAAEAAARQYDMALKSLAGRETAEPPVVLTCSALCHQGIDAVWNAIRSRQERLSQNGTLVDRRRRQALRWTWALVEQQLRDAVRAHAGVAALWPELERQLLAGEIPPEAAARRVLETFARPAARPQ